MVSRAVWPPRERTVGDLQADGCRFAGGQRGDAGEDGLGGGQALLKLLDLRLQAGVAFSAGGRSDRAVVVVGRLRRGGRPFGRACR